jgi:hypothetical protein
MRIVTSNREPCQNETKSGRLPPDRLGNSNQRSFTDDFELPDVLSINYSYFIYKINIQLHISLSNSHSYSITNSLFNVTPSQSSRAVRAVQMCRRWLNVNFILLPYCVGAFSPCGAGISLDAAVSKALAFRSGSCFLVAPSSSDPIDVSICFDRDSSTFENQTKQRLRCL